MSELFKNKQLIHIASEIVVLLALIFYFNSKNKQLSKQIEELAHRLEEQEDVIQQHDQVLKKIVAHLNGQPSQQNPSQKPPQRPQKQSKSSQQKQPNPSQQVHQQPNPPQQVQFHPVEDVIVVEEEQENDTNLDELDNELQEELAELQENNLNNGSQ